MDKGHGAKEVLQHQIHGHKCSPSTERREKKWINGGSPGLRTWQFSQSFSPTTGSQAREIQRDLQAPRKPSQDGYGGTSVITETTTYLLSRQHKHLPSPHTRQLLGSIWASPARWITWVRSWEWSIFSLCHPETQENQNTGDDSSGRKNRTPWFTASSSSWDCKLCSLMWETSGPCFLTAECVHLEWIQTPSRKTKQKKAEDHSESNTSQRLGAAFIPPGSQRHDGFSSERALTRFPWNLKRSCQTCHHSKTAS